MITTRPMSPARTAEFLTDLGLGKRLVTRVLTSAHEAGGTEEFFTPTVGVKVTTPGRAVENSFYVVLIKTVTPARR